MVPYYKRKKEDLQTLHHKISSEYKELQALTLSLDMSRGKPAPNQVALSAGMLGILHDETQVVTKLGEDTSNYGMLSGLSEAKTLLSHFLEIDPSLIFVGGNSSLNLMHDCISFAYSFGLPESPQPWCKEETIKFLCPVPGYDRHFSITEHFGFELLPISMTAEGPNMEEVEEAIKDPQVKGIWTVPKYSNPTGITYSDAVVKRLANLTPAAPDFRIFWDNAYAVHHLDQSQPDKLLNIMEELVKTGKEDMILMFSSTSKVTFPGGGISAIGASQKNLKWITHHFAYQTISYDKLNQLRHVLFLPTEEALTDHMAQHAHMLAPKFEIVLEALETLTGLEIAHWERPRGGYFIALQVPDGCAKRVVELCKEAGVTLTAAGATHPYGENPQDNLIRIAPSFPTEEELQQACELLCICVKLASLEKYLAE